MKKVTITIGNVTREANGNEYPMRAEPKSTPVKGQANGSETRVRFTSGKGKSAINNHYLYWVEADTLFYTRVTADEIARAKTEPIVILDAKEPQAAVPSPKVDAPASETTDEEKAHAIIAPTSAPKARRKGAKATA